jgi:hypothetical protein
VRDFGRGAAIALVLTTLVGACAREINDTPPARAKGDAAVGDGSSNMDGGFDAGRFGNADPSKGNHIDGSFVTPGDAAATVDAFFVNDPPPPMCGMDGMMEQAQSPGGSPQCPDDKNREGCPCPEAGATAACWPGKRVNRMHGICKDGKTTCAQTEEFGLRWSHCEGYVLPNPDATAGPEACGCFSSGTWNLTNLAPCIFHGDMGTFLYSSKLTSDGKIDCGKGLDQSKPPPVPDGIWSKDTLNIDCAGQFKLCYTIKAGDVKAPSPDDCMIMQSCVDVWYAEVGKDQALDDLPSWSSPNTECAAKFDSSGGYGEMTVIGKSAECDVVDDGHGNPYVFHRTDYCPPSCQNDTTSPECKSCQTGGSGMFN